MVNHIHRRLRLSVSVSLPANVEVFFLKSNECLVQLLAATPPNRHRERFIPAGLPLMTAALSRPRAAKITGLSKLLLEASDEDLCDDFVC